MDPKIWGKPWWQMLFSSALGYPLNPSIDDQYAYSRFYMLLAQVLPCKKCKENFTRHYRKVPINFYLHNRRSLVQWVLILHNEVNKSQGKRPLSLEEAIYKYFCDLPQSQLQTIMPPIENFSTGMNELEMLHKQRECEGETIEGFNQSPFYLSTLVIVGLIALLYIMRAFL